MKWTPAAVLAATLVVLTLAACPGETKRETCGNGIDDDGNGLTDCSDPDCKGQPACVSNDDAGYFGTCGKCGNTCGKQSDCISSAAFTEERPIPYCVTGRCTSLDQFIQVRFDLDTKNTWGGLGVSPQSGATRFIKKTAQDGSAVTCATVQATASDRMAPGAIEASNKYSVQGLDVTPITNPMLGQGVTYSFVNTQTGGDFLIWAEFWAGRPDSNTKLPTGRRLGFGCFEAPAVVGGPLVADDNCPSVSAPQGSCRVFRLLMPGPEP